MPVPPVRSAFIALALLSTPLLLSGCDATTNPEGVAGHYVASRFVLTADGESIDVLDAGGSLEMTLTTAGTVVGELTVPAELAEGETSFDLAGSYNYTEGGLAFDQTADTFIRDVSWSFNDAHIWTVTPRYSVQLDRD